MKQEDRTSFRIPKRLYAGGLIIAFLGLIWYSLCTERGTNLVFRWLIKGLMAPDEIHLGQSRGSFFEGLQLNGLRVFGPDNMPENSTIEVGGASLSPLSLAGLSDIQLKVQDLEMSLPGKVALISAKKVERATGENWVLSDLELRGIRGLPEGAFIRAQELHSGMPPTWKNVQRIKNGRVFFPQEEPIILNLTQEGERVEGRFFSPVADLKKILTLISASPKVALIEGELRDIDLNVVKLHDRFSVSGPFVLRQFSYESVLLSECQSELDLVIQVLDEPAVSGHIRLNGGSAQIRKSSLKLQPSTITLQAGEHDPVFNIAATTRIEGVDINVKLQGTIKKPEIQVSSSPPRPKGVLLIMLATGRGWKPAQDIVSSGRVDPEIMSDFIDYWFLGGLGNKLGSRLGVELVSVKAQGPSKGIEVQKAVSDNVDIGTGIQYKSSESQEANIKQSIEASYKINGTTKVNLEAARKSARSKLLDAGGKPQEQVNGEVLLKVKKDF